MPNARQALITYPGIRDIQSASYAMTPGISPNVLTLVVLPQDKPLRQGDVLMQWGSSGIRLKNCIVDKITATNQETWTLTILDRRWRWKDTGKISGRYNVRREGSAEIVKETEQTPRQLAALCLKAMGERRFLTSLMPNSTKVEIHWDYENPSEALQTLCDRLSCVVILRIDDTVAIVPRNSGMKMPNVGGVTKDSETSDPPERPDSISIVGAPTKYQADLKLLPLAQEKDGRLVQLDRVSYAPDPDNPNPWASIDPDFMNAIKNPEDRELAKKTAFRWYGVAEPIKLPGLKEEIESRSRVFPLLKEQIEQVKVDGRPSPLDPWIYGSWRNDGEGGEAAVEEPDVDLEDKPEQQYPHPFEIDHKYGIVRFERPVFIQKWVEAKDGRPEGNEVWPADIVLRIGVNLRDKETGAFLRPEYEANLPGRKLGTDPAFRVHEDVVLELYNDIKGKLQVNNKEARKVALSHLDDERRKYESKQPREVSYVGLIPWSCTGAITQVAWNISESGAVTHISRQTENVMLTPTTAERREIERNRKAARRADAPLPEQKRELDRADG